MKSSLSMTNTVVRAPGLQDWQASCVFQYFKLINIYCAPIKLTFHFRKFEYSFIVGEFKALDSEKTRS